MNRKVHSACAVLFLGLLSASNTHADRCPTPEDIRDRNLSTDYDWSVNEQVSLDALLSVKKLYGASVENYGEFIACKYEADQQYIRLDGSPNIQNCRVVTLDENWFDSEDGKTVCMDDDITLCKFIYRCG